MSPAGGLAIIFLAFRAVPLVRRTRTIAAREGINSHVSQIVNLTTLALDIVAAIHDDALPNHITSGRFQSAKSQRGMPRRDWNPARNVPRD